MGRAPSIATLRKGVCETLQDLAFAACSGLCRVGVVGPGKCVAAVVSPVSARSGVREQRLQL